MSARGKVQRSFAGLDMCSVLYTYIAFRNKTMRWKLLEVLASFDWWLIRGVMEDDFLCRYCFSVWLLLHLHTVLLIEIGDPRQKWLILLCAILFLLLLSQCRHPCVYGTTCLLYGVCPPSKETFFSLFSFISLESWSWSYFIWVCVALCHIWGTFPFWSYKL